MERERLNVSTYCSSAAGTVVVVTVAWVIGLSDSVPHCEREASEIPRTASMYVLSRNEAGKVNRSCGKVIVRQHASNGTAKHKRVAPEAARDWMVSESGSKGVTASLELV